MGFSTGLFVPWGMQGAMGREGKLHFLERTSTLGEESVASEVHRLIWKRFAEAAKHGL